MRHSSKAYRTAISRPKMSPVMKRLHTDGHLIQDHLDFGCGRGQDADRLGADKYDPHFYPNYPDRQYETVTCNFVLNVIENEDERLGVLLKIRGLLKSGGRAFVTVRNDKKALNGWTSKGTWQGLIELDLPVVYRNSGYVTYLLEN